MAPIPRSRTLLIGASAFAAAYFIPSYLQDLKTPGVRNIEKRWTSAGGASTHTPAIASPLGDPYNERGGQLEEKGVGSKYFEENFGKQRPEPNALGKIWNKTQYGHEKGKH